MLLYKKLLLMTFGTTYVRSNTSHPQKCSWRQPLYSSRLYNSCLF